MKWVAKIRFTQNRLRQSYPADACTVNVTVEAETIQEAFDKLKLGVDVEELTLGYVYKEIDGNGEDV